MVSWSGTISAVGKHDNTIAAIYTEPAPANVAWDAIESALKNKGAKITEGSGSRVRVALNGVKAVFHRPHPEKEASRSMVRSVRRFLEEAGVMP